MGLLASQATAANSSLSPWAQFGLGGIVIGALFATLAFFIRQHYQERKEWREDMSKLADKQDETSKANVDKFVELHEKTIDAIKHIA